MAERYKMTRIERAKQFAPFDALTGLGRALKAKEEEYMTVSRHELSEDEITHISDELCVLEAGDGIEVEYFCEGAYFTAVGIVDRINPVRKILVVEGADNGAAGLSIPFMDIRSIKRIGE